MTSALETLMSTAFFRDIWHAELVGLVEGEGRVVAKVRLKTKIDITATQNNRGSKPPSVKEVK